MRALAVAFAALAMAVPAAGGRANVQGRVAFLHGGNLIVLDLATGTQRVVLKHAGSGPVHWSGDGKLVSAGGRIVGGPSLPTADLAWAQNGETAAYKTKAGAVELWAPGRGSRTILPAAWGATSFVWGPNGRLALGRSVCRVPCGVPRHQEVWIWDAGKLKLVAGPLRGVQRPLIAGWTAEGRVLWWSDPQDSASIAADGLFLYANRTRIAGTLVFPDYVVRCRSHLTLAAGGDRYTTHGKRIVLDGRDVSHDPSRSWVSPACSKNGSTLVAAAGRSWEESLIGREHRAIWRLRPTRSSRTRRPAGRTRTRTCSATARCSSSARIRLRASVTAIGTRPSWGN